MIVVLGRPRVYRPEPDGDLAPGGLAVEVARAAARAGSEVELVGSIGDDPEGDRIVVELGRGGVGHSALMRDPSTRTPLVSRPRDARPLPRLEAADVELGLRYMHECRVLVISAELDAGALAAMMPRARQPSSVSSATHTPISAVRDWVNRTSASSATTIPAAATRSRRPCAANRACTAATRNMP